MAVNVGTLEAVLAARDTMSPVLLGAAERVITLTNQLGNLGVASVAEFKALNEQLMQAEASFAALSGTVTVTGDAFTATNAAFMIAGGQLGETARQANLAALSVKGTGAAAETSGNQVEESEKKFKTYGQSMAQVEGIATRLIERLVILYAIRGAATFLQDIFESADAMERLHEQTDLSIRFLQEFQYAGSQVGIPVEKLNSTIDTFQKKLAEASPATSRALNDIGLSFGKVFALDPDKRFTEVIAAIAGIESPLQRAKAEVALFGTDGIDPLVKQFATLSEQAQKTGKVVGDDTVSALANTTRMYRAFGSEVGPALDKVIDKGQKIVEITAKPLFGGGGWWEAIRLLSAVAGGDQNTINAIMEGEAAKSIKGDINLDGGKNDAPKSGWDLVNSYKEQSGALKGLTGDQLAQLNALRQLNQLTEANAVLLKDTATGVYVTSAQFKLYEKQLKDTTAEQKKFVSAQEDLNKLWDLAEQAQAQAGDTGLQAKIDKLDRQELIEKDSWRKKLSQDGAQQWQYDQAMLAIGVRFDVLREDERAKFNAKELDKAEKFNADLQRVIQQADDIGLQIGKRGLDLKLAQIQTATDREKAIWDKKYAADEIDALEHWAMINAITEKGANEAAQALANALFFVEGGGTGLSGPIPGMPLYKPIEDSTFKTWKSELGELTGAFKELSQVSSGALKGIFKDISELFAAINITVKATERLGQGITDLKAGKKGAGAEVLTGALSAGAGFISSTTTDGSAVQDVNAILGGAASGALIGSVVPGIGTAVGAVVGAAVGFVRSLIAGMGDGMMMDIARDAGVKFGQAWSESLLRTVKENASKLNDEVAGEIASLPQIIAENPISLTNLDMYESKIRDIFVMIGTGKFSLVEGSKVLNDVFPELAAVATDSYGRISDGLREIIELNGIFGTQSKAIADWKKQQGLDALGGYSAVQAAQPMDVYDKIYKDVTELEQKIKDQEIKGGTASVDPKDRIALSNARAAQAAQAKASLGDLTDLGAQAKGSYAVAVATGTSPTDAIKAQSAALTALEQEYKDLGITVDDTGLRELFIQNDLQKNAPNLIAGVQGLSKEISGLDNLGLETVDIFENQERVGYNMYVRLQAQVAALGGDTREALLPMQTYLQNAAKEAERLGIPLDANTQMMVDQSKALGIWDKNAKPVKDTTEKLAEAVERLVNWLDRIPSTVNTQVNVNTNRTSSGEPADPNAPPPLPDKPTGPDSSDGMSQGGVVQYKEYGGRVLPFRPRGTDTAAVMMTPGEGVVTVGAMNRIGVGGLSAINMGSPFSSGSGNGGNSGPSVVRAPSIIQLMFQLPQGQQLDSPDGISKALLIAMRFDINGARTAIETVADQRIAAAAGA